MKSNWKDIKNYGYFRLGLAVPEAKVANPDFNTEEIINILKEADVKNIFLTVFPEMCLPTYTVGDVFFNETLQASTLKNLKKLVDASERLQTMFVVGFHLPVETDLYNVAALIYKGKIWGIVPKTHLANYGEFYEDRWFAPARLLKAKGIKTVELFGEEVPIGTDLLFKIRGFEHALLGIEICEDLWVPISPSLFQALRGATMIVNLSASNDRYKKAPYRKSLVEGQSGRCICAYGYVSSGAGESSTDLVFGGHAIIAENGAILKESERFKIKSQIIFSDVNVDNMAKDKKVMRSFGQNILDVPAPQFRFQEVDFSPPIAITLARFISSSPFIPSDHSEFESAAEEILNTQVAALATRLRKTGTKHVVLGLSGGLDSATALIVAVETFRRLDLPLQNIHALTMPGFGTGERTKKSAIALAEAFGVTLQEIDITKSASSILEDIGHDMKDTESITYQNVQARLRKLIEFAKGNHLRAIDVGTGDLTEIALGWCTFSGDHISHYNVMGGVPKMLVRFLAHWYAMKKAEEKAKNVLLDIIDMPYLHELIKIKNKTDVVSSSEAALGPYRYHEFFLEHFVRWRLSARKIFFLAKEAFRDDAQKAGKSIEETLFIFLTRFFSEQWKRSVMADGPKVGAITLSPRGDWRMPSDADTSIWLKELDEFLEEMENGNVEDINRI